MNPDGSGREAEHSGGSGSLAHELRNSLAAVDLQLEAALEELEEGGEAAAAVARAREGIEETIAILAARLEGTD